MVRIVDVSALYRNYLRGLIEPFAPIFAVVQNLRCCTEPPLLYRTSAVVQNLRCCTKPPLLYKTSGVFDGSSKKPLIYMNPGLNPTSYRLGQPNRDCVVAAM